MDLPGIQSIINILLCSGLAALGWFARELWAAVKELKFDLAKLREEIPKQYVEKDDYREDVRELKELMNRIFDRLDNKQDKRDH